MPRNVRNFWIELQADGKKTKIATGPVARDGGFQLTVKMRDQGEITEPLSVWGYVLQDDTLRLEVTPANVGWRRNANDLTIETRR